MSHRAVTLGSIAKITSGGTPDRQIQPTGMGISLGQKQRRFRTARSQPTTLMNGSPKRGWRQSSARIVPKGTILMAMYGQGKTRGQVAILGQDAAINQACAAIHLRQGVDRDYVYQQLRFRYESIRALSNTGSQENLNAELIREIAFPLPEQHEQEAIAQRLVVWDAAIVKIEQLIAAKESSQRGWMQKLVMDRLFPEHRLSEFVHRVKKKYDWQWSPANHFWARWFDQPVTLL